MFVKDFQSRADPYGGKETAKAHMMCAWDSTTRIERKNAAFYDILTAFL
jgi:hypothetical protein